MRVLIIKLSSLGDLIHTFPALTEAYLEIQKKIPTIQFDWLVDTQFKEVPKFHPNITHVIDIPLRTWKKNKKSVLSTALSLRRKQYDLIIDAQGLIKSASLGWLVKGEHHGLDKNSARESPSHFFYQKSHAVSKELHAIDRLRLLFSKALNYSCDLNAPINYGLAPQAQITQLKKQKQKILFLHGTTWETKHWPEMYWVALGKKLTAQNSEKKFEILLPWGNTKELDRAKFFQSQFQSTLLPKLSLLEFKNLLITEVDAIISQDTGLAHLAAALNIPNIALYGPTDPKKSGPKGAHQIIMQAQFECAPCFSRVCTYQGQGKIITPPCFGSIPPKIIYDALLQNLEEDI